MSQQQLPSNDKLICVIGNIGVGKSELVKNIKLIYKDVQDVDVRKEPVKEWREIGLLAALYRDMNDPIRTGTAYSFQQFAFSSRLRDLKNVNWDQTKVLVVDGHVLIDRHVFTEQLKASKNISEEQANWYEHSFSAWKDLVPMADPVCFLYLRATPEVCNQRIFDRGRQEEMGIPIEYLTALHNRLDNFANLPEFRSRVVVVDASRKREIVLQDLKEIIDSKISSHNVERD